jgi:hypothetical protein
MNAQDEEEDEHQRMGTEVFRYQPSTGQLALENIPL